VLLESRYLAGEFSRLFRRSTPQDGHIYFSLSAFRWGQPSNASPGKTPIQINTNVELVQVPVIVFDDKAEWPAI